MKAMGHKKDNVVDFERRQQESREQLLERLFSEHGPALQSFLYARTGANDSEDVVQEVFVRLARLKGLRTKLNQSPARNRAYLFTMANNLVVDQERRNRLQRNYSEQYDGADLACEATPESAVAVEQDLSLLKKVITQMRPAWRQAFVLSRFKHMSYTQIATHMGV
ncbi:MAG: RNA polymerase sigma factor, partial [Porticoccaceae bacterium]|nr:RNA polymerase sigma factor [Porticoccaceae bacterium]